MAIEKLKGNRKHHIAGGPDRRMMPRNGDLGGITVALCGRYVKDEVIAGRWDVGDDDEPDVLFCLKCLDSK